MFIKGDIVRLKESTLAYNKGLLCKILDAEPFYNAKVEIVGGTFDNDIGKVKYANLKLFEIVRGERVGLYI
jgi:hypothetical protein|nr:MAG TPA: hypothetical protein [Caudoviricetes sp.]